MKGTQAYDVFLSFNQKDQGLAHFIVDALSDQGLRVFQVNDLSPGVSIRKSIRERLVECDAVVILVTPSSIETQHLAFEAGMAMAWSKPIHVLYDGVSPAEIPEFLRQFRVVSVSQISTIAELISKSSLKLTEQEVETLSRVYVETAVPVDRLLLQPDDLSRLTRQFNSSIGKDVGGERIARELMRLRKAGKLPRLSAIAHPA